MNHKYTWRDMLADALLCGGAALIVAGVTILFGVGQALAVSGCFSIAYGILAAHSSHDGGDGA